MLTPANNGVLRSTGSDPRAAHWRVMAGTRCVDSSWPDHDEKDQSVPSWDFGAGRRPAGTMPARHSRSARSGERVPACENNAAPISSSGQHPQPWSNGELGTGVG
jgi:hypothetical protein